MFSGGAVGNSAMVAFGDAQPQSLLTQGVVRDVSVAPGWMENLVYAYVHIDTLKQFGLRAEFDQIIIRVTDPHADREQVREIAYRASALLQELGAVVEDVTVPEPFEHIHAAQMDSLLLTQAAFGVLCLLVCAFLVVNLINGVLAGQAREIGIMKTLGGRAAQIGRLYLAMALVLGALATLLALPVALVAGHYYAQFKTEMLNFPSAGYQVAWWVIALQVAVGCLLPVLAAAIPVRRATAVSVASALRDVGIVAPAGSQIPRWLSGVSKLCTRPMLLALGNAFRRRQRMLLTLLVLASGGAVFLGAANLREAVRGSVDLQFEAQAFDLVVRVATPQPASQMEQIAGLVTGVEYAEAWRGALATLVQTDDGNRETLRVIGVPSDTQSMRPRLDQGRWLDADGDKELLITRALSRDQPQLVVGADVELSIDGKSDRWRLVGVVDAGTQSNAYVARRSLDQRFADDLASTLTVRFTPAARADELLTIMSVREALAAQGIEIANTQRMSEMRTVIEDHLLMVVDFLAVMGWLMLIVGGMGLASTMSLSVLERTREIGVMRAIGASHAAIMGLVLAECLIVAALGALLAVPLSIPMSLSLGYAFGQIMFSVPIIILPGAAAMLAWLGMMLAVAVLAGAWPALSASRVPVTQALAYE